MPKLDKDNPERKIDTDQCRIFHPLIQYTLTEQLLFARQCKKRMVNEIDKLSVLNRLKIPWHICWVGQKVRYVTEKPTELFGQPIAITKRQDKQIEMDAS